MNEFALIKYRDTNELDVVETDALTSFDGKTTEESGKLYWLNVDEGSGRSTRYKVQVILLDESREAIEARRNGRSRIRIPKVIDSSIDTCSSMDESSDGEPCDDEQQSQRGKKRGLEETSRKAIHKDQARQQTLQDIMRQRIQRRNPLSSPPPRPPTPPPTPSPRTNRPTPQTSKPPLQTPATPRRPTPLPRRPTLHSTRPTAPQDTGTSSNTHQCQASTSELDQLRQENKKLREMNLRLQEEILDRFSEGIPALHAGGDEHPLLDYKPENGQVSLGPEVTIAEKVFEEIESTTKPSLYVKKLAVAVFGSETLKNSSLEGRQCNRFKNRPVKQKLDANKLLAVKRCFQHFLSKQVIDNKERESELGKYKKYIREKIMDMNKPSKKTQEQEDSM